MIKDSIDNGGYSLDSIQKRIGIIQVAVNEFNIYTFQVLEVRGLPDEGSDLIARSQ